MSSVAAFEDNRPPDAVLRIVNPLLRTLVPSPAGRLLPASTGVLRFTGRRSGRTLRIVAGIHEVDGALVVFTSRPWRLNFRGGRAVEVARSGRRQSGTAELVEDPEQVAAAFREVLGAGTSPRMLGLRMEPGHLVTADDIRATGRTLLRLDLSSDESGGPSRSAPA
jgi:hypothetical protein